MRPTLLVAAMSVCLAGGCAGSTGGASGAVDALGPADQSAATDAADTKATAADAASAETLADAGPADAKPDQAVDAAPVDAVADTTAPLEVAADVAPDLAADVATDVAAEVAVDAAPDTALPPGQCSDETPCKGTMGAYCLPPGAFGGCGMCKKIEGDGCADDAACKDISNGICISKPEDCTCDGTPLCHPGCGLDADCGDGQVCLPNHHCAAKPCKVGSDCPALFACFKATGACDRKNCGKSTECENAGSCVGGKCYAKPGTCDFPKP